MTRTRYRIRSELDLSVELKFGTHQPLDFLHGDYTRNHIEKSIGPTKSISDIQTYCTKMEFLEIFYENYCF